MIFRKASWLLTRSIQDLCPRKCAVSMMIKIKEVGIQVREATRPYDAPLLWEH